VRNKLRRLAEFIQVGFPENLVATFKYSKNQSLTRRLALTSEAITFHRGRAETLWLQAGKQKTIEEKHAAAQAEIASFVFACLTGETRECADSTIEDMLTLGRQSDVEIIRSLCKC